MEGFDRVLARLEGLWQGSARRAGLLARFQVQVPGTLP
jgi:hypothetical protein